MFESRSSNTAAVLIKTSVLLDVQSFGHEVSQLRRSTALTCCTLSSEMQSLRRASTTIRSFQQLEKWIGGCTFSTSSVAQADDLKQAFADALPREQKRLKAIKTELGTKDIHSVNVNMVIGGMRGITGMLYETSLLDADDGIRFRGHSIPELQVRCIRATALNICMFAAAVR